ncbi:MAG TPA: SwmB domain-containing protein, partial [Gaiellaceae bacterium]|nr:SwmB domain-containing protein [Gaiellaceae bacterium]
MRGNGFVYSVRGGSVGVSSVGLPLGQTTRRANGLISETPAGPLSVVVRGQAAELLQTVGRHLGVRVWQWRLETPLQARVGADGAVGFFDPRTHLLAGLKIPSVRVFDRQGKTITPVSSRWQIAVRDGRRFLELRLDDAGLPLPYTIDPIATREKPTGSGTSGMTVAVPSTIEAGDLIVVHAAVVGGTGASSISPTISGGGGSFSVLNAQNNAGTALAQETFWKRAAASDAGATVTVTWSPSANAGAAEVVVEKGVATGGTIPQASSSGTPFSSTSNSKVVTCPAISAAAFPQNNMGLCLGAIAIGNTWPASGGSWSNVTSKANGTSLSIGSYSDLCATGGGCSLSATSITTSGSNARGSLGNDFDVPPDTAPPSADTISVYPGNTPSVQYFNPSSKTYYFGVIPASATFTFGAAPTDADSGVDHVVFPNLSGTTGWSSDSGGTVNYQSSGSYTSPTYWISSNPGTPAAANITAMDNNGNSLNSSISFVHDTTAPPTPAAPSLTGGYYASASVSVMGTDTTDTGAGTNAAASTMWRASATLNADGTCGSFGAFSPIGGWTSGTAHSDTTVTNAHCYQYEWQDADKVGNTAASSPSATAKINLSAMTLSGATVNGSTLTLVYADSLNLAGTPPAASAYSIQVNGGPALTPSGVSISGDAVTLTLPGPVGRGARVYGSYS